MKKALFIVILSVIPLLVFGIVCAWDMGKINLLTCIISSVLLAIIELYTFKKLDI